MTYFYASVVGCVTHSELSVARFIWSEGTTNQEIKSEIPLFDWFNFWTTSPLYDLKSEPLFLVSYRISGR